MACHRRKWSETESITSSLMTVGDDAEIPRFVFTNFEESRRMIHTSIMEIIEEERRRIDGDIPQSTEEFLNLYIQPSNLETSSPENSKAVASLSTTTPKEIGKFSFEPEKIVSAPPSPSGSKATQQFSYHNSTNLSNFLLTPPVSPLTNLSPKPLRRTLSARDLRTASLRSAKNNGNSFHSLATDFYGDSISAVNVSVAQGEASQKSGPSKHGLSVLMSGIYAVFIFMLGAIIFLNDQHREHRLLSELFSTGLASFGSLWLLIFHVDLCIYKKAVLKQLKQREDAMQEASERFSSATEYIINSGYAYTTAQNSADNKAPPFRFLQGRHSGSFYLKVGSAAFCFGYLIYQGLQLGQHIINFLDREKKQLCHRPSSIVFHIVSPLFAFYQLFVTFKYSNIVINRHKILARFGLMHLIATCLCNWFSTIVEEAVEDYNHKSGNDSQTEFNLASFHITVERREDWINPFHCSANSILSARSMSAIPYLYPFAIEYNLLLAGVWFIVWQNIGKEHSNADPHHIRHTISYDECGSDEIAYQSNLVINADCHSANKGLFLGLFLLLTIIVTVIVFFVAMTTEGYEEKAIVIHTAQEGFLTLIGLLCVIISFYQIRKLDVSAHPITFLDDVLLFVPLPFYFIHGIMSVMAEFANESYVRLAVHIIVNIQVMVQTPFIIDGLRRCSKSQNLRYKKPGRELITFLIILNLTLWIVNTFELKSVEHYHGQEEYFGDLIWMFVGHTTLPLMLFYRFHSSVCLADMWKSAYEKEMI